jgi:hypothetical protein
LTFFLIRFHWPTLPTNADWRVGFVTKILHLHPREVQKYIIATMYHTPYILPKELNEVACQIIETKENEEIVEKPKNASLARIRGISHRLKEQLGTDKQRSSKALMVNTIYRSLPL